jgi:hypothetical protein
MTWAVSKPFGVVRALRAAVFCAALALAGVCQGANYTWQGGNGTWQSANWATGSGPNQNWVNVNTAVFTSGTQTLSLGGSGVTLDNGGGNVRFLPATTARVSVTINSGTLATSDPTGIVSFYNNSGGTNALVSLTLNDVALRGGSLQVFAQSGREVDVTFDAMRNASQGSTIHTISMGSFASLRISATGNLPDSVRFVGVSVSSTLSTFVPITLATGTLSTDSSFIQTNGNPISVARWQTSSNGNRTLTLLGSGTLSAGTMRMQHGTGFIGTKTGTGTVVVGDISLATGTVGFDWAGGTNLINGTTGILGNWRLGAGATLGGSGTLTFAPASVLTGSAGSFFTADMTAGGLDIVGGTLSLVTSGSGVGLRLTGLLPSSTTTLMSWTTLSGSFRRITFDGVELTPDTPSPALNGGKISYTEVPNALVFIPVPEPGTVVLLAGGAATLALCRRPRRRCVDPERLT